MYFLSFCCPECGCEKFIFTRYCHFSQTRHGAACARCNAPLTIASCLSHRHTPPPERQSQAEASCTHK